MARRSNLREFQEHLAQRLAEAHTADHRSLLAFQAGGESWLINLAEAGEILPLPPLASVPLTRPWYRGLSNVRGTLYSIIDLAAFHDGPLTPVTGPARLLLIGARFGVHCALLVAESSGLRSEEDFEPVPTSDKRPWVTRTLRDAQGHPWLQIEPAALLGDPVFLDANQT